MMLIMTFIKTGDTVNANRLKKSPIEVDAQSIRYMLPKIMNTYEKTLNNRIKKLFFELISLRLSTRLRRPLIIIITLSPKNVLIQEIPNVIKKNKTFVVVINKAIGKAKMITSIGMSKFLKIVTYINFFKLWLERGKVLSHLNDSPDIIAVVSIIVINKKLKN